MSNDNKELKTKEICEGIKELFVEDLEGVNGGSYYVMQNLELPEVKPAPI